MEHDSLSFLTLINIAQSHSDGALRNLRGLCFKTPFFLVSRFHGSSKITPVYRFSHGKSQAFVTVLKVYSHKHIKSCNAEDRRQLEQQNKTKTTSTAKTLQVQHTFLGQFFAAVLHVRSLNVLVTRFMEEMSYVLTKKVVARVPVSFLLHCGSFLPYWPITFLIFSPPL